MMKILWWFWFIMEFSFVFVFTQNIKGNEIYTSSSEEQTYTKIINEKLGNDVVLKCKEHDKNEKSHNLHVYGWKFAHCDPCTENLHPSNYIWKDLKQKKRLHLRNITLEDRGRYICVNSIDKSSPIASYELRISTDSPNINLQTFKFIGRPPEILSIEKTDEIHLHENIVVKCKVYSPIVPRIWWVKQCEEAQKCRLNYDGKFYYKINVTYQVFRTVEENVYVGKLHLHNFTHDDDGIYVCVTMSELGKDYRNFTLTVSHSEYDTIDNSSTSLNFLFLIPFVFILIPICIECISKRIDNNKIKKNKQQEVVLLEVLSSPRSYHF